MERFLELIDDEDNLLKGSTLLIGIGVLIGVLVSVNTLLVIFRPPWKLRQLPFDIVLISVWIGFWLKKKYRLPKNKRNVGIFISLTTEHDKEKIRVKNDMVRKFEELVIADNLQDEVGIYVLNNAHAKHINPILKAYRAATLNYPKKIDAKAFKQWQKLRASTNGNYYIFGHVSERGGSENAYYLNTNTILAHSPLPAELRNELTAEFVNVWSTEVSFLEKLEKVGFEFTATYWYTGAKYMVGCAAFVSNEMRTALTLHEAVKSSLNVLQVMPTFSQTQKQLYLKMSVEHALIANDLRITGGSREERQEHIKQSLALDPKNQSGYLLRAIDEFEENNPKQALRTIMRASKVAGRNRTWMYSQGFLLMYMEQYNEAIRDLLPKNSTD